MAATNTIIRGGSWALAGAHLKTRRQSSMLMCHRRTVLSMEAVSRNCDLDQARSRTSAVWPTYVLCGTFCSTGHSASALAWDTDGFEVSTPAQGGHTAAAGRNCYGPGVAIVQVLRQSHSCAEAEMPPCSLSEGAGCKGSESDHQLPACAFLEAELAQAARMMQ